MTLLRVQALGRSYGALHALRDLTLAVPPGARHAVIGPNGAGKTTLLNLIAGTDRPSHGRVLLDGHDVTRLGAHARARLGIGRTWQHPATFARLSAADNVALAVTRRSTATAWPQRLRRATVTARAHDVLERVGLAGYAAVPAGRLPYGLCRLLEFAVVLAAEPRLLLLDEPSAGLDPIEIARITAAIGALPETVTVVFIDHNLDLVWANADTVTVLDHGRHLATGTPDEIRADPDVRMAYVTERNPPPPGRTGDVTTGPALLRVRGLRAGYRGAPVLDGLDLDVPEGATVAVLGRNGAGKTTLFNALAGLLPTQPPTRAELAGVRLDPDRPYRTARAGVAIVAQGRRLFDLTVAEHLIAAAAAGRSGRRRGGPDGRHRWGRDEILDLLPPLRARLAHRADRLSGGEQQMLAVARALLTDPRLLLLDEPSEGLAPAIVEQLAEVVRRITAHGVAVLIAEQHVSLALAVADRVLVLDHGRIAMSAAVADLTDPGPRERLSRLLGVGGTDHTNRTDHSG